MGKISDNNKNDKQICTSKKFSTTKVNVKGVVGSNSIYYIAVKVRIKRKNGHVDKYYLTDIYDNSQNINSLSIDKFYKFLIYPKKRKGDKEKIFIYGSYKA